VSSTRFKILVCRGPECGDKRCSATIYRAFQAAIAERGLGGRVVLEQQSCFGRCTQGPNALVSEQAEAAPGAGRIGFGLASLPVPRGRLSALYNHLTAADAAEILDEHVLQGRLVRRLIERPGAPPAADPGKDPTRRDP
jgi:(2Fe-2S) ferredoxin